MDRRLILPCALLNLALSDSLALFHTAQAAQVELTKTRTQIQLSQGNYAGVTQIHPAGCTCPICSRTTPVVEP
jgi:hypothetical protein